MYLRKMGSVALLTREGEVEIALGRQLPVDVLRKLDEADTVRVIAAQLESEFGAAASETPS
jgi:hypothetical protein